MNNIIKRGNSLTQSTEIIARNFSDFRRSFDGNISGVEMVLRLKDNNGSWHSMTQRQFKNGSIHIRTK